MAKAAPKELTLKVPVKVLGIDSNWEAATMAAYQYREKKVYPHLAGKGFAIDKCQGPLAKRMYVAPKAKQPGVAYLTGVGHGAYTVYTGDHHEPIFTAGSYDPAEPKGKIVHFLSCDTAKDLGPDFVRNGCLAYFGYDDDFVFATADQDTFFECDSEIDLAFADGLTAERVYDRTKALYAKRAADFRAAGKLQEAAMLDSDFARLRCPSSPPTPVPNDWGDPAAKLP